MAMPLHQTKSAICVLTPYFTKEQLTCTNQYGLDKALATVWQNLNWVTLTSLTKYGK